MVFEEGKNYNVPCRNKNKIRKTIELAVACGSKHISMYALTVEDGTPIYTDYLNGELPDADEVAELYEYGAKLLKDKGYTRYEVSNFAVEGYGERGRDPQCRTS